MTCVCGKRAAKFLCDELVPVTLKRRVAALRTGEEPSGTCDAPLCEKCRVCVGVAFFCGRGQRHDTQDRCPEHAPRAQTTRIR